MVYPSSHKAHYSDNYIVVGDTGSNPSKGWQTKRNLYWWLRPVKQTGDSVVRKFLFLLLFFYFFLNVGPLKEDIFFWTPSKSFIVFVWSQYDGGIYQLPWPFVLIYNIVSWMFMLYGRCQTICLVPEIQMHPLLKRRAFEWLSWYTKPKLVFNFQSPLTVWETGLTQSCCLLSSAND